jgi:hypothetical protein
MGSAEVQTEGLREDASRDGAETPSAKNRFDSRRTCLEIRLHLALALEARDRPVSRHDNVRLQRGSFRGGQEPPSGGPAIQPESAAQPSHIAHPQGVASCPSSSWVRIATVAQQLRDGRVDRSECVVSRVLKP